MAIRILLEKQDLNKQIFIVWPLNFTISIQLTYKKYLLNHGNSTSMKNNISLFEQYFCNILPAFKGYTF